MFKTAAFILVIACELNVNIQGIYVSRGIRQAQTLQKKRFHVENQTMANWYEALYHCRNHRGRLAAVETEQENDDVQRLITQAGDRLNLFWIGGSDEQHEGRWVWNTTGRETGYTAWQTGQPNNLWPGQHCLGYSRYSRYTSTQDSRSQSQYRAGYWWVDSDCDIRSAFVCELDH